MFATKYVTVISLLRIVCGLCRAGRSTTLCGVPGVLLPPCCFLRQLIMMVMMPPLPWLQERV